MNPILAASLGLPNGCNSLGRICVTPTCMTRWILGTVPRRVPRYPVCGVSGQCLLQPVDDTS